MKTLTSVFTAILVFFSLGQIHAPAQATNTYFAPFHVQGKQIKTGCGVGYVFYGIAITTNAPFHPLTNHMSVSFTNSNPLIQMQSGFGQTYCGHGTVNFTDVLYPMDTWQVTVWWSNNIPLPTNGILPITAVGF